MYSANSALIGVDDNGKGQYKFFLIKSNGTKEETTSAKAEEPNNHFRSVATTEDTNNIAESNSSF